MKLHEYSCINWFHLVQLLEGPDCWVLCEGRRSRGRRSWESIQLVVRFSQNALFIVSDSNKQTEKFAIAACRNNLENVKLHCLLSILIWYIFRWYMLLYVRSPEGHILLQSRKFFFFLLSWNFLSARSGPLGLRIFFVCLSVVCLSVCLSVCLFFLDLFLIFYTSSSLCRCRNTGSGAQLQPRRYGGQSPPSHKN